MAKFPSPEELIQVDHTPPKAGWMDTKPEFRHGTWCYPGKPDIVNYLGFPYAREWSPDQEDWKLPPDWQDILHKAFKKRLDKFRSLRVFMDVCVRCGACADKCHYYIGSGDPKNMPVLRAELMRSVYRNDFTTFGKLLGKTAGARKMDEQIVKEWFYYFYQCTECRRCSIYCPYGIDTAEITMMAREMLHELGLNINWILEPAANCSRIGNHLGIQPHAFKDMVDFMVDDIEEKVGIRIEPTINRKGAEILFITPSGDLFADPGTFTFMGYLILFHYLDLDYTLSAYASEGGNFGLFTNNELMKKINAKMYHEAKRTGAKWILGGECGHMWRVINQYMDTMNGPTDFMETPVNPITGTVFENAASTKMVHIAEFTADLIKHNKLKLDPSRNDNLTVTFHDSCNPARAMGMFDEPRYVLKNVCNKVVEMPQSTTREHTFCCGAGSGLNTEEFMETRMRGGLPRGNAVKNVRDKYGVNMLSCVCAIDRATLPPVCDYWAPGVDVCGLHELVGNALVLEGETRETDLRGEPLPGMEE